MDWHRARTAAEYIVIVVVLVALLFQLQYAVDNRLQPTQPKETTMKEHTKLLQPYRQRIEGLFADVEGMLRQVEQDHNATEESLVMQMADIREGFAEVGADVAAAVVAEAKRAR